MDVVNEFAKQPDTSNYGDKHQQHVRVACAESDSLQFTGLCNGKEMTTKIESEVFDMRARLNAHFKLACAILVCA